jgi:hypothetical protein
MNLEDTKKKETVRISKKDLLKLLSENERMSIQITELQSRMTELVEEVRGLRANLPDKIPAPTVNEDDPNDLLDPFPTYDPPHPHDINPNIYFDGSNGLGNGRRFGSNG